MVSYIRKGDQEAVELDGEWMILNSKEYTVTTLNNVGVYCWRLLEEEQTINSILILIKQQYIVEEESIQSDIEGFISRLIECGLVHDAR